MPPGLGTFLPVNIDNYVASVSPEWIEHGGVKLPMYQSEATWICFTAGYPFAVKIATGKINAVSRKPYSESLNRKPQDYVVSPGQPI